MSDHETIDVTTTDELQSTTDCFLAPSTAESEKCSYCGCDRDGLTVFHCTLCNKWVHSSCLHSGPPSTLLADNFYHFQCVSCNGKEKFERIRLTWNMATTLALYNLAHTQPGNEGFFRWKEDICAYIDQYWDLLFNGSRKKTSTWMNTVASTMSAGNPHHFLSGYGVVSECGWWKLTNPSSPPGYTPSNEVKKIVEPSPIKKTKARRSRNSLPMIPVGNVVDGLRKRNYQSSAINAAQIKEKRSRTQIIPPPPPVTPRQTTSTSKTSSPSSEGSSPSFRGCTSPISSPLSSPRSNSVTSMLSKCDVLPENTLPLAILSDDSDDESNKGNEFRTASPPPIIWSAPASPGSIRSRNSSLEEVKRAQTPDAVMPAPSGEKEIKQEPIEIPSQAIVEKEAEQEKPKRPKYKKLGLYEEEQLLKKLLSLDAAVEKNPAARRLRRKLLVRNKKRSLNLPIFDFETIVGNCLARERGIKLKEETASKSTDIGPQTWDITASFSSAPYRVLDRFQTCGAMIAGGIVQGPKSSFRQTLVGLEPEVLHQPIVSPYTQRVLKPFIRRDFESNPKKLLVLRSIVEKYKEKHGSASSDNTIDPIDYCYIRPHHVSNINTICDHFFWPGIDLSECLKYPDFTVVALYKKMIIGFGVMVPDVGLKEAYISYLFVHPDWRGGGIASFMIYHLIQTCMGKDVTLHVSASNPAMLLYQKFGFKPEQFIADFYDKYYPVGSKDCKHAFFMRLRR